MRYVVYHVAPGQDPKASGLCRIGGASVFVLSEDEVFSIYRYEFNRTTGRINTVNLIRKRVSVYLNKNPFRDEWRDGKTVAVLRMMLSAFKRTASNNINLPMFAAEVVPDWRRYIDLDQPEVREIILDFVGPNGETYPSCKCPGGKITNLVVDSVEKQIAFDNDEVMVLPPTACLRPFVLRANEWHLTSLAHGTAVADLIPRLDYKWKDLQDLPEKVFSKVVDDVLKAIAHEHYGFTFIDISVLPQRHRRHVSLGGLVRRVAESLPVTRKVELVEQTALVGNVGPVDYDFTRNRFSGNHPQR